MKKFLSVLWIFLIVCCLTGCKKEEELKVIKNLDFTVVSEERLPEELLTQINEKKLSPFKITFMDDGYVYICIGYGEQSTGGYSISVNALDQLANAIRVDTNLIGPKPDTEKKEGKSYPYIVIKTVDLGMPVVFD